MGATTRCRFLKSAYSQWLKYSRMPSDGASMKRLGERLGCESAPGDPSAVLALGRLDRLNGLLQLAFQRGAS